MLNLSPHCALHQHSFPNHSEQKTGVLTRQHKQDKPVHDQDGPEDRQIKYLEPTAHEPQRNGPRRTVPELKLGQSPYEGPELLVLFRGQTGLAVLQAFVLSE